MLKRRTKIILIASLILALVIPSCLTFVSSSSGSIRVNTTGGSASGQVVSAGGTINLYFGGIQWSGETFGLFLSQDGSSTVASGLLYTPSFDVYDLTDTSEVSTYTGDNGIWTVGNNWINGSIPATTALGDYYIKAIDVVGPSVAITDVSLRINPISTTATLNVVPVSGPGGIPITFTGSGYQANDDITIEYYDPVYGWKFLNTTLADSSGNIAVSSFAPDLKKSIGSSDYSEGYSQLSYRTTLTGNGQVCATANYNEYQRGLKTIGGVTAYGLYGNGTNLASSIRLRGGDTLALYGKWFYSNSPIYIRWDGENVVGTVMDYEWDSKLPTTTAAANANGSFNTTVTVPAATAGEHYLQIEDSQTWIVVKVFISPASLTLSPPYGPGGATVQFSGDGYPTSSTVDLYYLDPDFGQYRYWTSTASSSSGTIIFTAEIPDLRQYSYSGDYYNYSNPITFKAQVGGAPYSYADYTQYARGLQQVGGRTAYGLFGNNTDLHYDVNVRPGDSLFISGRWFHPGIVYFKFDGTSPTGSRGFSQWDTALPMGSTTASQSGSFQTYVTIPTVYGGVHSIAIEDTQTTLIISINVTGPPEPIAPTPTPTPSPTSNPTPTPTPPPYKPTPTIDLTCKGSATASGNRVEINGNLKLDGSPLSDTPVLISISKTNGRDWESLTTVRTISDGHFSAVWQPDVTGNYLVRASSEETDSMHEATVVVNLALTPAIENTVFTLNSNSTITQFAFNSTSHELSFIASGPSPSTGYVEIYIPKSILSDISDLTAYLDDRQISFHSESQGDSWLITFSYTHSSHTITMNIGESMAITDSQQLPWIYIAVVAVLAAVIAASVLVLKRRK